MTKPKCKHCWYAETSTFPAKDNKEWYSCRYHAPMPYANEKQTTYKDWRIVPEDFWCGQYKENSSINDELKENGFIDELFETIRE